ncbi:MAG: hypothetical protein FJW39_03830 [Acidobacteria bacterium]|nr:hypothetical protein [Acidobacteriota bacterium]
MVRLFFTAVLALVTAFAQSYKPGEAIEYRTSSETWEPGVFVREIPGGKQVLIRQKPSQFFPEGSERAYAIDEVRRPGAKPAKPPVMPTVTGTVAPPTGEGLLTREQVVSYAKSLMGPDPWGNPKRDAILLAIRDYVKERGTSFRYDLAFSNQMSAQGTMSVHINSAVDANHGKPPQPGDYMGVWLLRAANRGSTSVRTQGATTVVTRTDSQAESGRLTIQPGGSYVWEVLRGDPQDKWLRGTWRLAAPGERQPWEGGPALWLEKAKQGYDCMVRMSREPGWENWIEVGMGAARSPVEYGRRP